MSALRSQLAFVAEIDRLKRIIRRTPIMDGSRLENSAEHSWHLAVMAVVLAEHAEAGTDVGRVIRMVLVHDLVEIDAGDTFAYDVVANVGKEDREQRAADRIFGLLPSAQGVELRALWDEFEAGATPEARFAVALDRLQPLLANDRARGGSWMTHAVTREQVVARMRPIERSMPALWPVVLETVERHFGPASGSSA